MVGRKLAVLRAAVWCAGCVNQPFALKIRLTTGSDCPEARPLSILLTGNHCCGRTDRTLPCAEAGRRQRVHRAAAHLAHCQSRIEVREERRAAAVDTAHAGDRGVGHAHAGQRTRLRGLRHLADRPAGAQLLAEDRLHGSLSAGEIRAAQLGLLARLGRLHARLGGSLLHHRRGRGVGRSRAGRLRYLTDRPARGDYRAGHGRCSRCCGCPRAASRRDSRHAHRRRLVAQHLVHRDRGLARSCRGRRLEGGREVADRSGVDPRAGGAHRFVLSADGHCLLL
ncbi:protein of unknown function [Thauera humireducens]|nr:protein of unknown function [Thauera humireducens]